ncbi:hypothetical protein QEH57_17785 [Pelagicoccus sp. SDUM812005]|nr:hypothetical protein [Pelagicoccus sp. SDUM812005]MDQ8182526.1 hypothetical protein [Pelagicoccus sp. SDUM812005]
MAGQSGLPGDGRVPEPLVIHGEALAEVFLQTRLGPTPDLGAASRFYPKAGCENCFDIVVIDFPDDLSFALHANDPGIPDSCFFIELFLLIEVLEVLIDYTNVAILKLRHQGL